MAGKLIVFEGTDGSGKSTQFARLARTAKKQTFTVIYEHTFGYSRLLFKILKI